MRPSQLRTTPLRRRWLSFTPPNARQLHATARLSRPAQTQITEQEVEGARAHCANLLRRYDHPSHVLLPFIPPQARDAYLALRAFNIDIAQIADTTSTPTIGLMRMQFWRDAVSSALAGNPPKQPIAIMLAQAAANLHHYSDGKASLSKHWFHRIINTRAQYLGNPPYATLQELESYAENTYSTLLYLTLSALPQASVTTDHIASHIGKAVGIAAVLRGIPLVAFPTPQPVSRVGGGGSSGRQGAIMLPLDVMAEANVKEEDIFRQGSAAPGLRDAVFTVATRANDHLITARDMISKLRSEGSVGHEFEHQHDEGRSYSAQQLSAGKETQITEVNRAFGVFMPSVATQSWLDRLQKVDFDVFHPDLRKADWKLPWKAYWAYKSGRL